MPCLPYQGVGRSMEPTFDSRSNVILIEKVTPKLKDMRRDDLVRFSRPNVTSTHFAVKRVLGLLLIDR